MPTRAERRQQVWRVHKPIVLGHNCHLRRVWTTALPGRRALAGGRACKAVEGSSHPRASHAHAPYRASVAAWLARAPPGLSLPISAPLSGGSAHSKGKCAGQRVRARAQHICGRASHKKAEEVERADDHERDNVDHRRNRNPAVRTGRLDSIRSRMRSPWQMESHDCAHRRAYRTEGARLEGGRDGTGRDGTGRDPDQHSRS